MATTVVSQRLCRHAMRSKGRCPVGYISFTGISRCNGCPSTPRMRVAVG